MYICDMQKKNRIEKFIKHVALISGIAYNQEIPQFV